MTKHAASSNFSKWSTKEIVLFARWFGYTPQSVLNLPNISIKEENERNIGESELIQGQTDKISFNTKLLNWIENMEKNSVKSHKQDVDDNIVNVDEDEEEQRNSPLKMNTNAIELNIESNNDELLWINEICRRTKIRFEQEEIVEGKQK